ncbi:MAG: LysM peptidoglycan-binding domain-containing protein, partial [Planctomycetota bacterium]
TGRSAQKRLEDVLPKRLVEPAKSVGQRRIAAKPPKVMAGREYVVCEDDNLWRIAAEHLGDGNRYKEIVRLNAGILENENTVIPGMRLKLPLR